MKKLNKGNINKCHESVKKSVIKVAVSYRRIGFCYSGCHSGMIVSQKHALKLEVCCIVILHIYIFAVINNFMVVKDQRSSTTVNNQSTYNTSCYGSGNTAIGDQSAIRPEVRLES